MLHRFRRKPRQQSKTSQISWTVSYEDSDYFSVSEIRFLLQLTTFCSPRSDAKVERDLRRVTREIKRGKRILPSHASIWQRLLSIGNCGIMRSTLNGAEGPQTCTKTELYEQSYGRCLESRAITGRCSSDSSRSIGDLVLLRGRT